MTLYDNISSRKVNVLKKPWKLVVWHVVGERVRMTGCTDPRKIGHKLPPLQLPEQLLRP